MPGVLLPLFGSIAINSYGLFIAIGVIIFTYLLVHDRARQQLVSTDQLYNILTLSIVVAIVGGRALFIITERPEFEHWYELLALWQGGFSVLGAIIAVIAIMPWYLHTHSINALALFDRAAIYAPLLQSVSRVGCFFAGCCFGRSCSAPWAVPVQSDVGIRQLHPTQLYSSLALFIVFLIMLYRSKKPYGTGQLISLYLVFIGLERFIVDLWRDDRTLWLNNYLFSLSANQTIAIFLFILGAIGYWWTSKQPKWMPESKL